MKKTLLILFILINTNLVLSQTFNYNGINYQVIDPTNFYVRVGTNPSFSGVANIPETVNYSSQNYTVIEIGYDAFSYCTGLTTVTIPSSVTTISGSAFRNSFNLTSVLIPSSVTSIGDSAFSNCTGLTSITIPSSVTSIGDLTFSNCTSLTSLIIPSPATFINYLAFSGCTGLTSLTIASASIGSYAFYNCTGLTSLTLLSSVSNIVGNAFNGCTSLNTVNSYITTPLVINYNTFQGVNVTSCALNVPVGSEAAYEATSVWTDFNPINGNLLATDNFVMKDNIQLYPNPTKNNLFINTKDLTNTKLEVSDSNGKLLFNQILNSTNTIDTSNLSNGIYLFKVTSDKGSLTTKVIKN